MQSIFDSLQKLDQLESDHPAVSYCARRQVPLSRFGDIAYTDNPAKLIQGLVNQCKLFARVVHIPDHTSSLERKVILKEYVENQHGSLRGLFLIFPCRSEKGELLELTLRRVSNGSEPDRFYSILGTQEKSVSFGAERLNPTKPFYVVEGMFDQLILDQSIACLGFYNIEELLENDWFSQIDRSLYSIIFDHEIEDIHQLRKLEYLNKKGYSLCLFPLTSPNEDLNEKAQRGIRGEALEALIRHHTTTPGIKQTLKLFSRRLVYSVLWRLLVIKRKISLEN